MLMPETKDLVNQLREVKPYVYVATPYSLYSGGIHKAFEEACRASAWLVGKAVRFYCPIAHTHPIAIAGGLNPLSHEIWLDVDQPFMNCAGALLVVMMPEWQESRGIGYEVNLFTKQQKPVFYMKWPRKTATIPVGQESPPGTQPAGTQPTTILTEAERLVSGSRAKQYGNARKSHWKIAALWTSYLSTHVSGEDVARMMILLKIARDAKNPSRDSLVDIAGYVRCLELMRGTQKQKADDLPN